MTIDEALIRCQQSLNEANKARTNGDHDTFRLELEAVQYYADMAETLAEDIKLA